MPSWYFKFLKLTIKHASEWVMLRHGEWLGNRYISNLGFLTNDMISILLLRLVDILKSSPANYALGSIVAIYRKETLNNCYNGNSNMFNIYWVSVTQLLNNLNIKILVPKTRSPNYNELNNLNNLKYSFSNTNTVYKNWTGFLL